MARRRTNNKPTDQKPAMRRVNFEKPEGHQLQYSNVMQVTHTPYDFQMTFGLVDAASVRGGETVAKVPTVATIIISPQHAKQLSVVLAQNLEKYEANYMTLPIDLTPKADLEEGEIEVDLTEEVH